MAPALTTDKTSSENRANLPEPTSVVSASIEEGRETSRTRPLLRTLSQNSGEIPIKSQDLLKSNKDITFTKTKISNTLTLLELCKSKCRSFEKKYTLPESVKMNTGDGASSKEKKHERSHESTKTKSHFPVNMGVTKANTATVARVSKVGSTNGTNKLNHISTVEPKLITPTVAKIEAPVVPSTSAPCTSPKCTAIDNKPVRPVTRSMTKSKIEVEAETVKRQKRLDSRSSHLLKRLRRLQSRQAMSHVKHQLGGLLDHQYHQKFKSEEGVVEVKEPKKSSAVFNFLSDWQVEKPHTSKSPPEKKRDRATPLPEDLCTELDSLSGHLTTNLHHLQSALDSDATESSSGGESGEEVDYTDDWATSYKPSLLRRVGWQWAAERAEIASRWTWLQAQVSDLEYRIRQQNDIYKQIRHSKGEVVLDEPPPLTIEHLLHGRTLSRDQQTRLLALKQKNQMSPANVASLLSNLDKQCSQVNKQLCDVSLPPSTQTSPMLSKSLKEESSPASKTNSITPPNGILASHCSSKVNGDTIALESNPEAESAARCRPLRSEVYRKRKLLRTVGLHVRERKAARLSGVRCACYPPVTPCAMCGGRYNNTEPGDNEMVPVPERIALLDHSYHQVLSFKTDVPLSIPLEGLLKTGAWTQRGYRGHRTLDGRSRPHPVKDKNKRYSKHRLPPKSASAAVLSRIRTKYEVTRVLSALPPSPAKKRLSAADIRLKKKKLQAIDLLKKSKRSGRSKSESGLLRDSPSPIPHLNREARRKRTESAYDINNIVIPYSIAACTRVEKLQYKEIITPRWREVSVPRKSIGSQSEAGKEVTPAHKISSLSESTQPEAQSDTKSSMKEEKETKVGSVINENPGEQPTAPTFTEVTQDDKVTGEGHVGEEHVTEDLADDVFACRHLPHELDERKKFSVYTPTNMRRGSRANRPDSECVAAGRADSEGVEAMSPGSVHNMGSSVSSQSDLRAAGDSALSLDTSHGYGVNTPPLTPSMPRHGPGGEGEGDRPASTTPYGTPDIGGLRTRTNSVSSNLSTRSRSHFTLSLDTPSVHTTDTHILCWTKRTFPLDDSDHTNLFTETPSSEKYPLRHLATSASAIRIEGNNTARIGFYNDESSSGSEAEVSPPHSPGGSTTSSAVEAGDGAVSEEDPEWTVHKINNNRKPGIVLKISKR